MLDPEKAKICCEIGNKHVWNSICGIQAQVELSPLISVDDVLISKEIGKGSYGRFDFLHFLLRCACAVFPSSDALTHGNSAMPPHRVDSGQSTKGFTEGVKLPLKRIRD